MSDTSLTGREWHVLPTSENITERLRTRFDLPPLVATCLGHGPGRNSPEAWLEPAWSHLHEPSKMHGLEEAVDRIRNIVDSQGHIRVVTDYDVDGTTSSLILQHALRLMGCQSEISYHIPNRFDEGYGFSVRAADAAAADGVDLIITADIGVRDQVAVDRANEHGIDVIICDHHLPAGATVPRGAVAVLCPPQEDCNYPNPALAACGVSLKLATALLAEHPKRDRILLSMTKLAAIGTVADVVSLATPENRAIVSLGLSQLNQGPHAPGLQALLSVAGLEVGKISASDIGFRIGPRINAAGRLESATAVIELLNQKDPNRAAELAAELDQINQRRRSIQDELSKRAEKQISQDGTFSLVWGEEDEGWHRGVVGIVAARLRDRFHRPVAVAAIRGEWARGSIRSTPRVHAVHALENASDILERFGGHPAAAGFTIRAERLPELATRLEQAGARSGGRQDIVPPLEITARTSLDHINPSVIDALHRLGPFGKENPAPIVSLDPVKPDWIRLMGKKHLRMGLGIMDAVWWGGAEYRNSLQGRLELAGTLDFNTWKGRRSPRLTLVDVRVRSRDIV